MLALKIVNIASDWGGANVSPTLPTEVARDLLEEASMSTGDAVALGLISFELSALKNLWR